mgnify:CR=1 FL=1
MYGALIFGIDNYKNNLASGRVIIDSTCSTYEKEPWILMHDSSQIKYYDEDTNDNYIVECDIQPYRIYMNNLERIRGCYLDNNELYVNEVIGAYLDTKEEMKNLDEITVKSLFRTCIESINPELPHSSVVIKGIKNSDISYSVKLKNIKLNFGFALDMILGVGNVLDGKKSRLIFWYWMYFVLFLQYNKKNWKKKMLI